jgi:dephospho-CoA kinase
MITLGILGGVASGKSAVATTIARLVPGAVRLDADRAGHEALTEPDVVRALTDRWGPGILNGAGQIDRPQVAKIVFAPGREAEREFLERLTHPLIHQRLETQRAAAEAAGAQLAILDAALLLEAGWGDVCDQLLFVATPDAVRLSRGLSRGWTAEEFARREAAQWPVARKRAHADWVIDNVESLAELEAECAALLPRIMRVD